MVSWRELCSYNISIRLLAVQDCQRSCRYNTANCCVQERIMGLQKLIWWRAIYLPWSLCYAWAILWDDQIINIGAHILSVLCGKLQTWRQCETCFSVVCQHLARSSVGHLTDLGIVMMVAVSSSEMPVNVYETLLNIPRDVHLQI
jgi:hypothetical protein